MTKITEEIVTDIRKLRDLEAEYLKYTYETKRPDNDEESKNYLLTIIRKSSEAYRLRYKIVLNSQKIDVLQVRDDNVRQIFNEIRKEKDTFHSVSSYISILELLNKDVGEHDQIPTNLCDQLLADDNVLSDFHGWFDYIKYFIRRIKIGPIIYSSYLPNNVKNYFSEVRDAYAFGLYRSSVIMCRSIIEISLFNKLQKRKFITDARAKISTVQDYLDDKLIELIRIAEYKNIINKRLSKLSHEIRKAANKVLHLKEDDIKLVEDEAMKIIRDTVEVVEHIYK